VKFEREQNGIGKALSREEEKNLLAACGSNALLNAGVTLALNTALRKNEIRILRWSQIDFEKRTVAVGRAKTEGGSGRVIPLNQPAFDALAKWAGRLVMFFPRAKQRESRGNIPTASALTQPGPLSLGALPGVQP
jgi:integrase